MKARHGSPWARIFAAFLFVSFLFLGFSGPSFAGPISRITDIKSPYFNLKGEKVLLASMEGKVVLVTFWASWCAPCLLEVPTLNRIHRRFASRGLVVIAVSVGRETPEEVRRLSAKFGMLYNVGRAGEEMTRELSLSVIPTAFLFAPDGSLKKKYTGSPSAEVLLKDIEGAMGKK